MVSIDVWRLRIGLHCSSRLRKCSTIHNSPTGQVFSPLWSVPWLTRGNLKSVAMCIQKFHFFCLLIGLLIGNIEWNPGPSTFKCHVCPLSYATVQDHVLHQKIHATDRKFQFKCPVALCSSLYFQSATGLNHHVNMYHPSSPGPSCSSGTSSIVMQCDVLSCNFNAESISKFLRHKIEHLEKNVTVQCPVESCSSTVSFAETTKLQTHLQKHSKGPSDLNNVSCHVENCQESLLTFDSFHEHFTKHFQNNVAFPCPLKKLCTSSVQFHDAQSLRSHLSIKHAGWRQDKIKLQKVFECVPGTSATSATSGHDTYERMDYESHDPVLSDDDDTSERSIFTTDLFFKHIGKFYLMLEAEYFLPESTVDSIADSLKLMSELFQYQTNAAITNALKDRGMKDHDIVTVTNAVSAADVFYAAHHKGESGPTFTSAHLRAKYTKEKFTYIPPKEISLDLDKEGGATAHMVSPRSVLNFILQDPGVQKEVLESFNRQSNPNIIQDYSDGSVCKKRPSYGKERIDIIAFQDAFTAANPLGSAKKKYKMNGFYWTLGNFRPHVRSKVEAIFLAYLVNNDWLKDRKNYGPRKCFQPLINEFKSLEMTGIEFMGRRIPVVVQFVVGDSLGAHEIGGFIGSFSGYYFCRFCDILRSAFRANPCQLNHFRTIDEYYQDLEQFQEKHRSNSRISSHKGVNADSVLNQLSGFHVCDPALPPCIAHDVFEKGVGDVDLSAMIAYFVNKNWFSYDILENLVNGFKCVGTDAGNKPAVVPASGKKLGGHAVQNWTLIRLLPFIIQNYIEDPKDAVWQLYLKLKRLVEYACAPAFTEEDLKRMKKLSHDYMSERVRLLGSSVKPKHHFLMHYADLIPLVGPIIHLFTLRFEAKHQFFKRVAKTCRNFINLGTTLAHRHQVFMSYLSTGVLFSAGIGYRKSSPCVADKYQGKVKDILTSGIIGDFENLVDCGELEHDGWTFKKDAYLLLQDPQSDSNNITIGKIKCIITCHHKPFLILEKFEASLLEDFGIYKVEDNAIDTVCVPISDVKFPVPQAMYDFKDETCFSLKHFLTGH